MKTGNINSRSITISNQLLLSAKASAIVLSTSRLFRYKGTSSSTKHITPQHHTQHNTLFQHKMAPPPLPPGKDKHHIVILEAVHVPMPTFDIPHTLTVYPNTDPSQVAERIKDASIVVNCIIPITPSDLDAAPTVRCVTVTAVGLGWMDKAAYASRNVTVTNCRAGNVEAVCEHFLALYFSTRKRVVQAHNLVTTTPTWLEKITLTKECWTGPPLGCKQETLGIIGYGTLGQGIETLAKSLNFKEILIADRKSQHPARTGRIAFDEVLRRATALAICVPKENDTINLIDEKELAMMRPDVVIINVARGGIVNEAALAKALKEHRIMGAATDVMDVEPSGPGRSPLIPKEGEERIPNLTICEFRSYLFHSRSHLGQR